MNRPAKREWDVYSGTGDVVAKDGMLVILSQTRTVIADVSLEVGGASVPLRVRGYIARTDKGITIRGGEPRKLVVRYLGEPPLLSHVVWIGSAPADSFAIPVEATQGLDAQCAEFWELPLQAVTTVATTMTASGATSLQSALGGSVGTMTKRAEAIADRNAAEEFFLQLDKATDPTLDTIGFGQAVLNVSGLLAHRIDMRASLGAQNLVPEFEEIDNTFGELSELASISQLFKTLVGSYLSGKPHLFEWAFELFASDQLGVAHFDGAEHAKMLTHGRPNGIAFFQFAELALCCTRNEIDVAFWDDKLLPLVRVSQVFAENAPQGVSTAPAYPMAPSKYFAVEGRHYRRDRIEYLRTRYESDVSVVSSDKRLAFLEDRFTALLAATIEPGPGVPVSATRSMPAPAKPPTVTLGGGLAVAALL